jgi:predicted lactoylglutathione lyase
MTKPKLNLVVLRVSELVRSERFYAALGLRFQYEQHERGPSHLSATIGGTAFELYPASSEATAGSIRLGFSVENVQALVKGALEAGGSLVQDLQPTDWGKRAVLADPDGHKIELVEA